FSFAVSSGTFRQPSPGPSMHPFRWLLLPVLAVALLAAASVVRANPQVQLTWQLLDYIAVDYAGAVKDGQVISDFEYAEMSEFSATVGERLAQLPEHEALAGLQEQAAALQAAVEAKADPAEVERLARALADGLLQAYPVPQAPATLPDLAAGDALYQQYCATCHGTTGAGDGPAAAALDPPPIDFTDAARARARRVFALQQVVEH